MRSGKAQIIKRIELSNQESIRTLGQKENYKYLGILQANSIKQVEMKEKNNQRVYLGTRKLFETKLCSLDFIKGINIWAVSLIR